MFIKYGNEKRLYAPGLQANILTTFS